MFLHHRKEKAGKEKGNALFLVLIAVGLFAALSFAISQSGRGGGRGAEREIALVNAANVTQYAGEVTSAITRMLLTGGCSVNTLNFDHDDHVGYENLSAPGDGSCDVFGKAGGGVNFRDPPGAANTGGGWIYTGGPVVHTVDGSKSTLVDENASLVMILPAVREGVCVAINAGNGVNGIPDDAGAFATRTPFTGTLTATEDITGTSGAEQPSPCLGSPASPNLCGKLSGCFRTSGGELVYYNVLKRP